jgi:sulfur carrier protein ThiS
MTQEQIVEKAESAPGTWVFVNDQLVSTADVADMNIDAGSRIRLMPGLVGGNHC